MLVPRRIKTQHGATRPIPMLMEWVWSRRGRFAYFWLFHAMLNIFVFYHKSYLCIKTMILKIYSNECKLKIYCMERKVSYFLWIMLNIVGCTQKNQNLARRDQAHSNDNGMGLDAPWRVCLFLSLSCLGEHIFILSQLLHLLKNYDIGKCDKKSRINTNVCK